MPLHPLGRNFSNSVCYCMYVFVWACATYVCGCVEARGQQHWLSPSVALHHVLCDSFLVEPGIPSMNWPQRPMIFRVPLSSRFLGYTVLCGVGDLNQILMYSLHLQPVHRSEVSPATLRNRLFLPSLNI